MIREYVISSNIGSVGYDYNTRTLEIEFRGGGIYQYFDVNLVEYVGLMNAPSHGKYFHSHIKYEYRYERIK